MAYRPLALLLTSVVPACVFVGWDDDHHHGHGGHGRAPDAAYEEIDPCAGAPGVEFPAAICVCDSFTMLGNLDASGFDPGTTATVGVNGHAVLLSNVEIDGTLHADGGLELAGNGEIGRDIVSARSLEWMGNLEVGGDLNIGGDLEGLGNLELGGDLRLGGNNHMFGNLEIGGHGPYISPAQPPCPCDPGTFFDVAAAVDAAAGDPSIAPLSAELDGNAAIQLRTGDYYVRDATWLGNLELVIDGHVDLFIDGSMSTLGNGELELRPGSTLDVYIAGSLETLGNTWIGGGVPGAVRVYVGGPDGVLLSAGNTEFVASIYAPEADVSYLGNTEILGAIFARSLTSEGNFEIAYPGLLESPGPQRCLPPASDDGGAPPRTTETPGGDDDGDSRSPGDDGDSRSPGSDTDGDPETTGDDPETTGDAPETAGDDPATTGGDSCPEVDNDCYAIEDKFACMDTPECYWKHGSEYCTWQTCGGLDQTLCTLDPACAWSECLTACYPA